jgi:hypothetical protein
VTESHNGDAATAGNKTARRTPAAAVSRSSTSWLRRRQCACAAAAATNVCMRVCVARAHSTTAAIYRTSERADSRPAHSRPAHSAYGGTCVRTRMRVACACVPHTCAQYACTRVTMTNSSTGRVQNDGESIGTNRITSVRISETSTFRWGWVCHVHPAAQDVFDRNCMGHCMCVCNCSTRQHGVVMAREHVRIQCKQWNVGRKHWCTGVSGSCS